MRLFDSSAEYDALGNPMPSRGCPATDFPVDAPRGESESVTSISYEYDGPSFAGSADAELVGRYTYEAYDYDVDAALYDNDARCYDPGQGRWLNKDPLGFNAGDSNLYRYVYQEQPPAVFLEDSTDG